MEECREKKESLNPNTRKLTIDLERAHPGWEQVTVPVDVYYERCRPLIESTSDVVERLLESEPDYPLDTLYVTGGGSELPPVARVLKETFGRRVKRSAYMRSASAVGLAIRAGAQTGHGPIRSPTSSRRTLACGENRTRGRTLLLTLSFRAGQSFLLRAACPAQSPHLSARAQHRALPLPRVHAPESARPADWGNHQLGRDSLSV